MTKEQEEAIKYLEMMLERMDFNQFGYVYAEDSLRTVLNMLKAQQRKIKTLTQTNRSYKGMIKKKDKQIDLMAKYISGLDIDEDICKEQAENYGCDDINREVECKECVKKYFERKANNEN